MGGGSNLRGMASDVLACLGFFTRLPAGWAPHEGRSFGATLWAAPVAGVAVGLIGAAGFALGSLLTLPPAISALLALAATLAATGALHEDGLADVADGFGGGTSRERKLAIMRDSRIGTFGAAALFVSLGLRWAALAEVAEAGRASLVLVAAHGASRALLPAFLHLVPPARPDGLGAGVGRVGAGTMMVALLLGALCLLPLGIGRGAAAMLALALWFAAAERLCRRQIGGQTGDVCGAVQQGAEILVLLAAVSGGFSS